jgi:hypothetical protein
MDSCFRGLAMLIAALSVVPAVSVQSSENEHSSAVNEWPLVHGDWTNVTPPLTKSI